MEKSNNKISSDDILIRKACKDDNFEEIAELVYETDPYIYPYWFHDDVEECKEVLAPLLDKEGFFFNYKSMHVAIDKKTNKIVGLVQVVDTHTNFNYDYTELMNKSRSYDFTIKNYIFELIEEVNKLGLPYFSNLVVHHDCRGIGLGRMLMEYILKECRIEYIDVLAENKGAVELYRSMGYDKIEENYGFKNDVEMIEEYRMYKTR